LTPERCTNARFPASNTTQIGTIGAALALLTRRTSKSDVIANDHRRGSSVMATRKKSTRKYGKAASKRVESAMKKRKKGTLRSGRGGKGGKVTSRKQAIAIGLSEARAKGAKVPKKRKTSGGRKKAASKRK
jgi:hypothetical protein